MHVHILKLQSPFVISLECTFAQVNCTVYSRLLYLSRQVLAHHRPAPGPHLPPVPGPHQGLLLFQRSSRHQRRRVRGLPVWLAVQPHPVGLRPHGAAHGSPGVHHMDRVSVFLRWRGTRGFYCSAQLKRSAENITRRVDRNTACGFKVVSFPVLSAAVTFMHSRVPLTTRRWGFGACRARKPRLPRVWKPYLCFASPSQLAVSTYSSLLISRS